MKEATPCACAALLLVIVSFAPARGQETQSSDPPDPHSSLIEQAHEAQKPSPSSTEPVAKSGAEDSVTVAEAYARRDELAGQSVSVRGRVVKYNAQIMGRNWVHLQDGTGTPAGRDFDLTATSAEAAEVGTIVTVRGTLQTARDFGAGYRYEVIVEDATIEVDDAVEP